MKSRAWNRPLPEKILLGGEIRFPPTLAQPNPGWILHHTADYPQNLAVEPLHENSRTLFRLYPRFSESTDLTAEELGYDSAPYLESYSWDWIEFRFQPLKGLVVRSTYWVPDSSVICGEYWITNRADHKRDILVDMVCTLQSQGVGNQIVQSEIDDRPILTGSLDDNNITLFLAGNPAFREDPFPILRNKISLEPNRVERIHWVCLLSETQKTSREVLTKVLELDWAGEISHRKVKLEGQLEITTGDPERDFTLAHSQNLGLLRYHQLTSQENGAKLNPIQGLMLLQALINPGADMVKNILDLVFNHLGQPDQAFINPDSDQTPPLMAGELLWQTHQMGFSDDTWHNFLDTAAGWLENWFSPGLDKDGDGIPELVNPRIFDLAGSSTASEVISEDHLLPYPYLESPALGAILYNDLCRIDDLLQISGMKTAHHLQKRKETLLAFLQDSWSSVSSEFQNWDSHSHLSVTGSSITKNLQPGLNILRKSFPQPTRIGIMHHRFSPGNPPVEFSFVYHGLDSQENYRIEEHKSGELYFGQGIDWGISECVYSKLDYCIINNPLQKGQINLIAPSTSIEDITQSLPLWAGALPEQQAREIFEKYMLDPDRCWSPYGFSSSPESGQAAMYLFWNLLLGQSLYTLGMEKAAAELIEHWMEAAIPALESSGASYPAYSIKYGQGFGVEDSLESLFPVRFLLQVLGLKIIQDSQLIIEGVNPFSWPVTVKFRGHEIKWERKQTSIMRSGRESINLAEGDKFQIDLY